MLRSQAANQGLLAGPRIFLTWHRFETPSLAYHLLPTVNRLVQEARLSGLLCGRTGALTRILI